MSKMISVSSGFQYSVNIGYDLNNDDKLKNFIPTKSSLALLEDILFNAGDENMPPFELKIDEKYVNEHLKGENKPVDIRKFIL